jgi:hypothetical protein
LHFDFFSYKEKQPDRIELKVSKVGWFMEHSCYRGTILPSGMPHLQHCLQEHDSACPPALGDAFEELWEAAVHDHLSDPEIQKSLDEFSHWVTHFSISRDTSHGFDPKAPDQQNSPRRRSPA